MQVKSKRAAARSQWVWPVFGLLNQTRTVKDEAQPKRPIATYAGGSLLMCAALAACVWAYMTWWPAALTPASEIEAMLASGQYRAAERAAARWTREKPRDPAAWYTLARARAGLNDLEGTVEALRKIPDWSVRKGDARFFEGKAFLKMHKVRLAEEAFLDCIRREERGENVALAANARLELMALYAMQERWDAFKRTVWDVYARLVPSDRLATLTMRMRSEFEQTRPDLNIEALRLRVDADPDDVQSLAGLATAYDRASELGEAVRLLKQAVQKAPHDDAIWARYLDVLYRSGAIEELRTELARHPERAANSPEVHNLRGVLAQSSGDFEAAESAFRRALDLRPDVPEYHHRLGQVLLRLGKPEEAAHEAAERSRLIEAREALRLAWNDFADTNEKNPADVTAAQLRALARACAAASMTREADAWEALAREHAQLAQPARP